MSLLTKNKQHASDIQQKTHIPSWSVRKRQMSISVHSHVIWIVGLLSREIAARSSMSWPIASPRKDPISWKFEHCSSPDFMQSMHHQVYTVQGADRERQGWKEILHLASRLPARLMSEESYQLIVEVPRGRVRVSLGVTSDRFVSSNKEENFAFWAGAVLRNNDPVASPKENPSCRQ